MILLVDGGAQGTLVNRIVKTSGISKWGTRDVPTPRGPKFFYFHAVFGHKIGWCTHFGSSCPLRKVLDPPLKTTFQSTLIDQLALYFTVISTINVFQSMSTIETSMVFNKVHVKFHWPICVKS